MSERVDDDVTVGYAEKVLQRHVPVDSEATNRICRWCQQRSPGTGGEPTWPCDARKLALLVLQRKRVDALLWWVTKNVGKTEETDR